MYQYPVNQGFVAVRIENRVNPEVVGDKGVFIGNKFGRGSSIKFILLESVRQAELERTNQPYYDYSWLKGEKGLTSNIEVFELIPAEWSKLKMTGPAMMELLQSSFVSVYPDLHMLASVALRET